MRYSKPQVMKLGSPIDLIQSNNQKVQASFIESTDFSECTPMAYEADE
jgi:hypothetical protein